MKTWIQSVVDRRTLLTVVATLLVTLLVASSAAASSAAQPEDQKAATPTTITTGSGDKYKTTVEQKPGGQLSAEDFRQVSLLTSRIVLHINDAVESLNSDRTDDARAALEKGVALTSVVRQLLPTTDVTTIVRDAKGAEVYRHVDRVQDDRIPLFEGLVAVKVLEAIADAKQDAAAVKGVRLADADVIHTSVLVDLDYVEEKLKRAKDTLLTQPKDTVVQLLHDAQSNGIAFSVNKQDDPLVAAQMALQLAEQMVQQERPEAAKLNLQQAKNYLVMYRGLVGEKESDNVKKLEGEISKLQANIEGTGAAQEIRTFWDQVTSWFSREHRETRTSSEKNKEQSGG